MRRLIPLLLATCALSLGAERPPNIVLIMADDMGFSDIGCYGAEIIQTPNLDRLADEGLRFTAFYNNAKCTTTRASLLTGLYPRNGGRGISDLLTPNMLTLGEAMHHAGYHTSLSGKWHNGSEPGTRPYDRGFDEAYGLWDGCCNFFDPNQPDPEFKGGKVRFFGHNDQRITDFPDDFFTTDAFADHAIETITRFTGDPSGKPFFAYIPFTAPPLPAPRPPRRHRRLQRQIQRRLGRAAKTPPRPHRRTRPRRPQLETPRTRPRGGAVGHFTPQRLAKPPYGNLRRHGHQHGPRHRPRPRHPRQTRRRR